MAMEKNRLEAFTDGVLAVVITILVLELKAPHEATWQALLGSSRIFLSYVLSFVYIGIYWNNHHHMLQLTGNVNGKIMWANLHLLFWLSLLPFVTSWLNEAEPAPASVPTALYGFVLLMAAIAWIPLKHALIGANGGRNGELALALGTDWKARVSPVVYASAIVLAFFAPIVSCVLYAVVAAIWFVPDRRIEKRL